MRGLLVSTALVLAVTVVHAQQNPDDGKELQGAWKAIAFEQSGKEAKGARIRLLEGMSWEFRGGEFAWRMEGQIQSKGVYKINPSQSPKEIDLFDSQRKIRSVGIYELQGGTLRIRFNGDGDPRPKAFTTEKGTRNHFLIELERPQK